MTFSKRSIILASRSTARRELLREAGFKIGLSFADIDESRLAGEAVEKYAIRIALAKAKKVALRRPTSFIIGVDTVISLGNKIFGKPSNKKIAKKTLLELSGKWHRVLSGTVLLDAKTGRTIKKTVISRVKFAKLTSGQIDWYIKTGEPLKAAGAYSIQSGGRQLVASVDGCFTNIVGISMPAITAMLKTLKAI